MKYQTEQKKQLAEFLKAHPANQYSCEELGAILEKEGVGKSTVYRLVSEMEKEGLLRRFPKLHGRGTLYQYHHREDCANHLHLKCISCGMLKHLDCALGNELLQHIEKEHGFTVDNGSTVIYGLCENCKKEAEKQEGKTLPHFTDQGEHCPHCADCSQHFTHPFEREKDSQ